MANADLMGRAFSPQFVSRHVNWGVAPGWFESAPLALAKASSTRLDDSRPRIRPTLGLVVGIWCSRCPFDYTNDFRRDLLDGVCRSAAG